MFECAEAAGVRVPTSCVKQGKCRECLVEVEEGAERLTPPAPQEEHLSGRFRLSCRARIIAPGVIRCHTLRRNALRVETETTGLVSAAPLEPSVTRSGRRVLLEGRVLVEAGGPLHGLAVDVGTTTVAVRLYDLESGALVATNSFENPQRFGGTDVMARIRYDGEHKGKLLQRTLLGYLGHAIEALPCDPLTIYELVVVGNPTMRDLFFGLDVEPIGRMPYRSVTEEAFRAGRASTTSVVTTGARLRLPVHAEARVVGLPLVGSHVGADAAACALATGLLDSDEVTAVIDIGTNTEVIVGNRHRLLAASCPAGPAFEGGGVACGMPALEGAVERVRIREDGGVEVHVIGEGEPAGICGSGLVDLLSELRRTGGMNEQGRLADERDRFEVDAEHGLFLSERDINELAQAKGANAAGLRIAVESYGLALSELPRLDLAGGFARYLDTAAARRIGLIPDLPDERLRQVGNAALEGASIALRSLPRRRALEEAVRRIEHVRLETHPRFFDVFVEGCQFEPFGREAV
ncbi:MAG: ferredoxin [Acidobacteria bacterium]|nr:MAG: ferredoxin [Acidobacteriota bacterium]